MAKEIELVATQNEAEEINGQIYLDALRGADGYSAYEIARKYGYEGTEEEWIKGLTPKRGVDYWTEEDIGLIQEHCDKYIDEKIIEAIGGEY